MYPLHDGQFLFCVRHFHFYKYLWVHDVIYVLLNPSSEAKGALLNFTCFSFFDNLVRGMSTAYKSVDFTIGNWDMVSFIWIDLLWQSGFMREYGRTICYLIYSCNCISQEEVSKCRCDEALWPKDGGDSNPLVACLGRPSSHL